MGYVKNGYHDYEREEVPLYCFSAIVAASKSRRRRRFSTLRHYTYVATGSIAVALVDTLYLIDIAGQAFDESGY